MVGRGWADSAERPSRLAPTCMALGFLALTLVLAARLGRTQLHTAARGLISTALRCCALPSRPARHEQVGRPAARQVPDPDGFDAAADTVGAGIYSGRVLRDPAGNVMLGRQHEDHNPAPGPLYAGGGYAEVARAIHAGPAAVEQFLAGQPDHRAAANEVMTGGATPLHTCGMSRPGQLSTQLLIDAGAEIEAVDTYGYTPLHRMASNNLHIGAEALLKVGANVNQLSVKPYSGDTPLKVALQSGAAAVARVLQRYGGTVEGQPVAPEALP